MSIRLRLTKPAPTSDDDDDDFQLSDNSDQGNNKPKRRGRPPGSKNKPKLVVVDQENGTGDESSGQKVKKKRGRPRKDTSPPLIRPAQVDTSDDDDDEGEGDGEESAGGQAGPRRKRYRNPDESDDGGGSDYDDDSDDSEAVGKRRRGRPLGSKNKPKRSVSDSGGGSDEDEDGSEMMDEEDGDEDEDDEDGEPSPAEIGSDLDPINSGAVTPAVRGDGTSTSLLADGKLPPAPRGRPPQFAPRRKETKVIKGTTYTIIDDEIQLEVDERGEAKIDADGNLLGDRKYTVATFTSPMRQNPNKVYMLSIDAARASGFRDSLYFFRKNPLIHKLSCSQHEKDRLIDMGKLSANLKSRSVTMVSARNCFKIMGAVFVANGKHVFDDYYEDRVLAAGHKPGEPANVTPYDPERDPLPHTGKTAPAANSRGFVGGASKAEQAHYQAEASAHTRPGVGEKKELKEGEKKRSHHAVVPRDEFGAHASATFGGTGLQPFGKTWDPAAKKAKPASHLSPQNWMHEYAKAVTNANRKLRETRMMNVTQVQVGLGLVEKEEDKMIEIEVEVTSEDEAEMMMMMAVEEPPSSASGLPAEGTPQPVDGTWTTVNPTGASASPAPLDPSLPTATASPIPSTSNPIPARQPTPAVTAPLSQPPAKRTRLEKVYHQIHGVYDPETNVPHVYRSTQPTHCTILKVDNLPHVDFVPTGDEGGASLAAARRGWEKGLATAGLATVEYIIDENAYGQPEQLLPGIWDFREMEREYIRKNGPAAFA
ncbi:hypothetical protein T439DRAFT_382510 [Meredithblackwellia eburnea MCA 4105]